MIIILAKNACLYGNKGLSVTNKLLYPRYDCLALCFPLDNQNQETHPIHSLKAAPEIQYVILLIFCSLSQQILSRLVLFFSSSEFSSTHFFLSKIMYILESFENKYDDVGLWFLFSVEDNCVVKLLSPRLVFPLPHLASLLIFCLFFFSSCLVSPWLVLVITFQAVTCKQLSVSLSVKDKEN